jgi:hypothetical protein
VLQTEMVLQAKMVQVRTVLHVEMVLQEKMVQA